MSTAGPWWQTDTYTIDTPVPWEVEQHAGPQGLALVKAWPDGRTDPGWGLHGAPGRDGFWLKYNRGEFNPRRVLYGYNKGKWAFAFIMRSMKLVCVDIDGKNGGFDHVKKLGMLPHTMAETSKSGNGYHLFYSVEEEWTDQYGFGRLSDRIGIEQGVDIRATGCVYHHENQRWNGREIAPLPAHLYEQLTFREQKIAAVADRIEKVLVGGDEMEVLMMQDEMLSDLAKPIPQGKRNQTLFALGSQLCQAQVYEWDVKVHARAIEIGLDTDEADKLVANIQRYAATTPAP